MKFIWFVSKVLVRIFKIINVFIGQLIFINAAGFLQNLLGELLKKYAQFRFPDNQSTNSVIMNDVQFLRQNGYLIVEKFVDSRDIVELNRKFSKWCVSNSVLENQGRLDCSSRDSHRNFLSLFPQTKYFFDETLDSILTKYYGCEFEIINISLYRTRKPDNTKLVSTGGAFGGTACWHSDGSFTDTLKVFFLLSDVSENDGPMQLMDKQKSKAIFKRNLPFRAAKHGKPSSQDFDEISASYTGKRGTCLIVDTNRCLHRASIPTINPRDMLTYYVGVKIKADKGRFTDISRSGEGLMGRL